jgi:hypothetical protein
MLFASGDKRCMYSIFVLQITFKSENASTIAIIKVSDFTALCN